MGGICTGLFLSTRKMFFHSIFSSLHIFEFFSQNVPRSPACISHMISRNSHPCDLLQLHHSISYLKSFCLQIEFCRKDFYKSNEWRLHSKNVRIRIKFLLLTSWCQRWIYRHYLLVSRAHSTSYFWLANRRISVHNRRYRSLFRVMTRRCCWVWST